MPDINEQFGPTSGTGGTSGGNQGISDNPGGGSAVQTGGVVSLTVTQQIDQALAKSTSRSVYTSLSLGDDIVRDVIDVLTTGFFTGNSGSLGTFFTSSLQTSTQKQYYYEVYNANSAVATSRPQFSVTYGHVDGSGSLGLNEDSPSKAIYSQYKSLLLNGPDDKFKLNAAVPSAESDGIYVVTLNRLNMRDRLDPGNWQLNLSELSGSAVNNVNTGSNVSVLPGGRVIKLIDDSGGTNKAEQTVKEYYNIVSGSIQTGRSVIYTQGGNPVYYGRVYPSYGAIILNESMLNASASFRTVSGSNINGDNAMKLFKSISGSYANHSLPMQARSLETVKSTHYFVRLKNGQYNYSLNPTYVSGSTGKFTNEDFETNPVTYITSVGLYNDANELLAVAKLSKPTKKSFSKENIIKIKLDW